MASPSYVFFRVANHPGLSMTVPILALKVLSPKEISQFPANQDRHLVTLWFMENVSMTQQHFSGLKSER